jgi:hypothetical protein
MGHRSPLRSLKCEGTLECYASLTFIFSSHYKGAPNNSDQPLALVGKGITFDSGGISLKAPAVSHFLFVIAQVKLCLRT